MNLILISIAPVLIIITYVYYRDKYDREPWKMLVRALVLGAVITVPVIFVERFLSHFSPASPLLSAAYSGFVVAGFTEETFKFVAFMLFVWKSIHFNEKFDGIVYAVFISLGFAAVENVLYVMNGGYRVGIIRALTAVPAHALFGVVMGYHLALARFFPKQRLIMLFLAWILPVLLHGFYNFCLMAQQYWLLLVMLPFLMFLWVSGFRKMKYLSDQSIFRNDWSNPDHFGG
jgi:RsiW-degrading membrane proteinase PrsW (M82 family)